MKTFSRILLVTLTVGIFFIIISVIGGLNIPIISDFFNEDEAYGDMISYEVTSEVTDIIFDFGDRHVNIEYIETGNINFNYYVHEDDTWGLTEEEGVLTVSQSRKFNFFKGFTFKFSSRDVRTVNLYIPVDYSNNLTVNTDVGDIDLDLGEMTLVDVLLSSDTGDIDIKSFSATTLNLSADTGDISFTDINILETIKVSNDTGDIAALNVSANHIEGETSTGDIHIENIEATTLILRNSTGSIRVEESDVATSIKATTSTGNVRIENSNSLLYDLKTSTGDIYFNHNDLSAFTIKYDLDVSVGNISIDGQNQGSRHVTANGDISIFAESSTGNIRIRTQQP